MVYKGYVIYYGRGEANGGGVWNSSFECPSFKSNFSKIDDERA